MCSPPHFLPGADQDPNTESGYSHRQGTCSYGRDDRCTFVLLCLLSGGTSAGRCGSSLLYTCCMKPSTRSSLPADHDGSTQLLRSRGPPVAARATQRKYQHVEDDDSEISKDYILPPCMPFAVAFLQQKIHVLSYLLHVCLAHSEDCQKERAARKTDYHRKYCLQSQFCP